MSSAVQVRLTTLSTGKDYVTEKQWQYATLKNCPWHPDGGCGFCRHGTYPRVRPPGTLIPRWYCPTERRTVSALPDALAAHYSGTLADLEAHVLAVEAAASMAFAAMTRRMEVELPGALRYLSRLCKAVRAALNISRGLLPQRLSLLPPTITHFSEQFAPGNVLSTLRALLACYLPDLPAPLGFNPSRFDRTGEQNRRQHQTGHDPPSALLDPVDEPLIEQPSQERAP